MRCFQEARAFQTRSGLGTLLLPGGVMGGGSADADRKQGASARAWLQYPGLSRRPTSTCFICWVLLGWLELPPSPGAPLRRWPNTSDGLGHRPCPVESCVQRVGPGATSEFILNPAGKLKVCMMPSPFNEYFSVSCTDISHLTPFKVGCLLLNTQAPPSTHGNTFVPCLYL